LLSNEFQDSEVVKVGENRGQLFVRLPTRMTARLGIKKAVNSRLLLMVPASKQN